MAGSRAAAPPPDARQGRTAESEDADGGNDTTASSKCSTCRRWGRPGSGGHLSACPLTCPLPQWMLGNVKHLLKCSSWACSLSRSSFTLCLWLTSSCNVKQQEASPRLTAAATRGGGGPTHPHGDGELLRRPGQVVILSFQPFAVVVQNLPLDAPLCRNTAP